MTPPDPKVITEPEESAWSVIAWRVGSMETKLDSFQTVVLEKLDKLAENNLATTKAVTVLETKIPQIDQSVVQLGDRLTKVESDVVTVRLTMAERLLWGGIGGGAITGLIEIIKVLVN